jgi:hypothetical protein
LFGILLITVGAILLARHLRQREQPLNLPANGPRLWIAVAALVALAAFMVAASAGRLLLLLVPLLLLVGPLLLRRAKPEPERAPADVIETGWFRAFKPHPTLPLDAVVARGAMQGRRLSELGLADLVWLHQQIDDQESLVVLEGFLTREFPGWRERVDRAAAELMSEGMTAAKAREILGLGPEAGPDDIVEAHRRLMQRLHPGRGGSDYLASLLNQAKSVLLERR